MTPTFVCKAREDNSTRWCPSYVCWSNTVTGSIYHDISTINKYHSFSQVMYVNFAGQHLGRQEFLRLARYDSNLACVNSSIFWKPQLVVDLFRAYTALSIYIYIFFWGLSEFSETANSHFDDFFLDYVYCSGSVLR